jgi:hypothetical protein
LWFAALFKGKNIYLDKAIEYIEEVIKKNATLLNEQEVNIDTELKSGLAAALGIKSGTNNIK